MSAAESAWDGHHRLQHITSKQENFFHRFKTHHSSFRNVVVACLHKEESSSFRNVVGSGVYFKTMGKVFLIASDVLQVAPLSRNSLVQLMSYWTESWKRFFVCF